MSDIGQFVCNYAILRFQPYPETEEFVNLGVVLHCAVNNYFGVKLENKKHKRIFDFFPELSRDPFKRALEAIATDLHRVREQVNGTFGPAQSELGRRVFREVVRVRESIFRFSEVKTVLTRDPEECLEYLFSSYVQRNFTHLRSDHEAEMTRRYLDALREYLPNHTFHQNHRLGSDEFHVRVPLASDRRGLNLAPARVIKPLDLCKDESTAVFEHGDAWIARLKRLKEIGCQPDRFIFPIRFPIEGGAVKNAGLRMVENLREEGAEVVMEDDMTALLRLADD